VLYFLFFTLLQHIFLNIIFNYFWIYNNFFIAIEQFYLEKDWFWRKICVQTDRQTRI